MLSKILPGWGIKRMDAIKLHKPVFLVVGLAGMFMAATAGAADLVNVYQLAVDNYARLQADEFEFKASSEAIIQARAGLLPEVGFEADYTETEQKIVSSDTTVFATGDTKFPSDSYNLTVNIPIFRYDAWKRYSQSKAVVKQAHAELLASQQQLMFDTAEAYFKVLGARDTLAYAQSEMTAVGRQLELAQERVKRGLATVTDLRDAQARYATAESKVVEAESDLEDAYRGLSEFTGEFITELNKLQASIPLEGPNPSALDEWIGTAMAQNYSLEASRQAVEVASDEARMQRAGHYPTLDFVGRLNNRDTNGSLFGGGSEVRTTDYMLRLNVPLYQGGSTSSKIREAGFNHQKSRRELEADRRSLERETRMSYQGVLSGIKKVEALKKSVEFQESALEVKEEGLKAGINTMLGVLDAQRDLYFSRRDYSQARYDYLLSVLRLKKASGSLSPEDLQLLNGLLVEG